MNQEKIGKLIKELRLKNNLTQDEFAKKYNVTYQAVSKWETGKNMPDIALLRNICKDFNISLDKVLEGEYKKKSIKYILLFIGIIVIFLITVLIILKLNKNEFEFKTISTTCNSFNITGSTAYNKAKSSIYISNIKYCGGEDNTLYKNINCSLYEEHDDIKTKIDEYKYDKNEEITLEKFLQNVTFHIDNYERNCKNYKDENLFIEIEAIDKNEKIISYKIPLTLEKNCPKP